MNTPKIVITGGLGFIFSYVTEYFVRKGWQVVVIDNLSAGANPDIIDGSFVHHNVHTSNPDIVPLIIKENPDYLIHAAAITDVDYSTLEPHRTMTKNTLGTLHAFEAARRLPNLKKFMYVATDEIYGECDRPMTEEDLIQPRNPYSCSKAVGSLVRVAYDNTFPILKGKTVETRMCNIFGARQDTRKIMPQIKKSLEEGYSIPLHQDGTGYREYLYVKNVAPAVDLILREGTGAYNISLGNGLTVRELIQRAETLTGKKVTTHEANRPGMDMQYQADATRLLDLGWKPLYTFDEGLKEYLTEHSEEQQKKTLIIGTNDLLMAGAQRLAIDQLNAVDRTVFDVHLVVLMEFRGQATFDDLIPDDVTVHRIRYSGLADIAAWQRLYRVLSRVRPDIVKTATFFSNITFLILKVFFGYAVIAAEHNTVRAKPTWQRFVDRLLLPRAFTVVADSKAVVDFVSSTEGIAPENFTIIYNGVDLDAVRSSKELYARDRASIRAEYDIPSDAFVIFTASRLVHQKNHHLMLEGFAKVRDREKTYLVIAGGGKYAEELKVLAEERNISDRVLFLGEQKNLHRLYATADMFLLTSRHEGFCIAAMEGLAFGLPLVSTRVAGVSEYLRDGENGFFIEATPEDIAAKIERVVDFSSEERSGFSRAAEETAENYSLAKYADEFTSLLKRIVGDMDYSNE
ncbi:MAG: dTDP-glucose 4,6-dehydratase [Patescibacteria group bacterium]|nr:dTDP-glucose 4,6-dehydratase [Patescibacteria group bacterium]